MDDGCYSLTRQPLATLRSFGEERLYTLAPMSVMGYAENPFQRMRKLLENWVNRARPWLKVDAPKIVEVTAFRKDGKVITHLVNSPVTTLEAGYHPRSPAANRRSDPHSRHQGISRRQV